MSRSSIPRFAWVMFAAALFVVVAGFALVPFLALSVLPFTAGAETSIAESQGVPAQQPTTPIPAPAQIPGPAPAASSMQPTVSLTGAWRVESYMDVQGGVVSVLPDVQVTTTFGEDGSVSGNAGCNGYRGPYTIAGNQITFGSIISTRRACLSQPLNQQEQACQQIMRWQANNPDADQLLELGCDRGQEFFFARPLSPEAFGDSLWQDCSSLMSDALPTASGAA